MKLLINICAHDGIISHYNGVGTMVQRYISSFIKNLDKNSIEYEINLFAPECNNNTFGYSASVSKKHKDLKKVTIFEVSNGSAATINYGTPYNWKELSQNTALIINNIDMTKYDRVITFANDTPFAGLLEMLETSNNHFKFWVPHSTGKIHLVDSSINNDSEILNERIEWETDSIDYINEDRNSFLVTIGEYIKKHLIEEYQLDENKAIMFKNGEILDENSFNNDSPENPKLFEQIMNKESLMLSFGRAEIYKNLDATMRLGSELGIDTVVIAQGYYKGQPLIEEYKKEALKCNTLLYIDPPFSFAKYILNNFHGKIIVVVPSKKEIMGLVINEIRKLNKSNIMIVANDIDGLREQISDGYDGIITNLDNIKESAQIVNYFIKKDKFVELNSNSQKTLVRKYNLNNNCDRFLKELNIYD